MKKSILIILITLFSVTLPFTAFTAYADFEKIKLAVLDFELQGEGHETKDMGEIVAEWLITALVKKGRFDVIERRLLKKVLAEQELAVSGVIDESSATQLGQLLGVKTIISGSVMKIQNLIEVNARIIDVQNASIIAAERVQSNTAIRLEVLVAQMAEKIIKDFPLEGYIVNREGQKVLLDLGGTAGVARNMQFVAYKEGDVIKHPKTGKILVVRQIETGLLRIISVNRKISEAEIVNESYPGSIQYGQQVKNLSEPRIDDRGALFVNSSPLNAKVRILNIKSPYQRGMTLPEGRYHIQVSLDGFHPADKWVQIKAGKDKEVNLRLQRVEVVVVESGHLFVNATPKTARIRILNIEPAYQRGMKLGPGKYHVEVSAQGYEKITKWVFLGPGQDREVEVNLPPIEIQVSRQAPRQATRQAPRDTAQGHLFVKANPQEAQVRILNSRRDYSPGVSLNPGRYRLQVTSRGYHPIEKWIRIFPGENREVRIRLKRQATTSVQKDSPRKAAPPSSAPVVLPPRGATVEVALFPWLLQQDAGSLKPRIVAGVSSALLNNDKYRLSASYYKTTDATVASISRSMVSPKAIYSAWTGKPNIEKIVQLGGKLGVDAVLVGVIKAKNSYSDKYQITKIHLMLVDVRTKKVTSVNNVPSGSGVQAAVYRVAQKVLKRFN